MERGIDQTEEAVRLYDYEQDAADVSVGNLFLLRTYVVAGRYEDAIRQIVVMLSRPSFFGLGDIELDPLYDPLREDPRYGALIRQAGQLIEW